MRRMLIAGNWKMNLDRAGCTALAQQIAAAWRDEDQIDIAVFPPFPYLESVGNALQHSRIAMGAQNLYHETQGAFTGEVSPAMLVDMGCGMVLLGHSERRTLFGESDENVNRKLHAALTAGLTPVVCVGETLAQRESGETKVVIETQVRGSLADISAEQLERLVIAYEPVWAIGTGKVATGDQAQEVHEDLRKLLELQYNSELAGRVRILYGGSVKGENAHDLLGRPDIDGALVGGASLSADSFGEIADAARTISQQVSPS